MIKLLRVLGYVEGLSFLCLLFIAMPLKYAYGYPFAVKVAGSLHGLFFMGYAACLAYVSSESNWPGRKSLTGFVAAVLPFGTFFFDRVLAREIRERAALVKA